LENGRKAQLNYSATVRNGAAPLCQAAVPTLAIPPDSDQTSQ
jgi:hypothetical protein